MKPLQWNERLIWIAVGAVVTIGSNWISYSLQEGKMERQKLEHQKEIDVINLDMIGGQQLLGMYEALGKLVSEKRALTDAYIDEHEGRAEHSNEYQHQRYRLKIGELDQQIEEIRKRIAKITGRDVSKILGIIPGLPPTHLRAVGRK